MIELKKILIFGGSSLMGSHLIHYLLDKYRIITTYHTSPIRMPNLLSLPLDLFNKEAAEKFIQITKPDVVIYAATQNSIQYCQENPKISESLNNSIPVSLSYACEKRGIKLIFISSVFVFSGEHGHYKERDNPRPLNAYGSALMSAEYSIQKNCSNYLIIRTPVVFGRSMGMNKSSLLEYIERSLFLAKNCNLDNRLKIGFLSGHILGKIMHVCLDRGIDNRIIHVSSKDTITHYEFALHLATLLKANKDLINVMNKVLPIDDSKVQFIKTNYNFSLDSSNMETLLNTAVPNVAEQIENYYKMNYFDPKKIRAAASGAISI